MTAAARQQITFGEQQALAQTGCGGIGHVQGEVQAVAFQLLGKQVGFLVQEGQADAGSLLAQIGQERRQQGGGAMVAGGDAPGAFGARRVVAGGWGQGLIQCGQGLAQRFAQGRGACRGSHAAGAR